MQNEPPPLKIKPVISYPREVQVGKSYLLSIDVQLTTPVEWPYIEEEYPITFSLDTFPYFTFEPIGEPQPAVILHRFGGTYGPAEFLLTAGQLEAKNGVIGITFLNGRGLPITHIKLACEIKRKVALDPQYAITITRQRQRTNRSAGERSQTVGVAAGYSVAAEATMSELSAYPDSGEHDVEYIAVEMLFEQAGWTIQDYTHANIHAERGVAIRNFPTTTITSESISTNYLLFVDQQAVAVAYITTIGQNRIGLEAPIYQNQRIPLIQGERPRRYPIPFTYEIIEQGTRIRFFNHLDPKPHSRSIITFHRPETLLRWLSQAPLDIPPNMNDLLRSRLLRMPRINRNMLSNSTQYEALRRLEQSLAENNLRALIQMSNGRGKTTLLVQETYRLLEFGNAQRILYLTGNSSAYTRFMEFKIPNTGQIFTEQYKVQILQNNQVIDPDARVCIASIEQLYAVLSNHSIPDLSNGEATEQTIVIVDEAHRSREAEEGISRSRIPKGVQYNPAMPIEIFDAIMIDDYDLGLYREWWPVLEYFDAFIIGVTGEAGKQMRVFFNNNIVYKQKDDNTALATQDVFQRLWRYADVLRDNGLHDYLEQLTYLLFLKMADERTRPPYNEPPSIPRGYDWQSIIQLQGDELATHYQHTLERLGKETGMLGIIFHNAYNKIRSPAKLRDLIIDLINRENWTSIGTDVLGDVYERLLQRNFEKIKSDEGQYFSPRPLIQAIIDVMRPEPGQRICDPVCGTGGFLIGAHDYIEKHYRLDRNQRAALQTDTFYGWETNNNVARLCAMNLFLHSIGDEKSRCPIAVTDSLLATTNELFNIVLSNPPFGYKSTIPPTKEAQAHFWVSTSNMDLNFVQLTRSLLKVHGRAAIVVPNNVLFAGGPGEIIRRRLLHDCDLHTILRLPGNLFYHTSIRANVLFFDAKPANPNPWTERLWIYDLNSNQKYSSRRNPIMRADFDEFVDSYHPENRYQRQESERFRSFTYDELLGRDKVNLNISWLETIRGSSSFVQKIVASDQSPISSIRQPLTSLPNTLWFFNLELIDEITNDSLLQPGILPSQEEKQTIRRGRRYRVLISASQYGSVYRYIEQQSVIIQDPIDLRLVCTEPGVIIDNSICTITPDTVSSFVHTFTLVVPEEYPTQEVIFQLLYRKPRSRLDKVVTTIKVKIEGTYDLITKQRSVLENTITDNRVALQRGKEDNVQIDQPFQQTSGMIQQPPGSGRPATTFLSYAREDAEEVSYLQELLYMRGVQAWRDVTSLALGGYTRDEIVQAIAQESDAFVLYLTPQSLESSFIWNVEVPAALQRWERDRTFNLVPILRGVTFAQVQRVCAECGYPSLADFNSVLLPAYGRNETKDAVNQVLRPVAGRILKSTLHGRLRRVGADSSYEPRLCLYTFPYIPATTSLDLDLNWTEMFTERWPTQQEWQESLLPALRDVKDTLSAMIPTHTLHMIVQAPLPTAFVLGFNFSAAAHLTLILERMQEVWSTAVSTSETLPLLQHAFPTQGDSQVAVVEVAISHATMSAVARSLPSLDLSFGHHVQFIPPDEPSNNSVKDAGHAQAMVRQISRELKRLYDREGVSHVHLFMACPAALAVMLGHQLNALRTITLYQYMETQGRYTPVCTLTSPSM